MLNRTTNFFVGCVAFFSSSIVFSVCSPSLPNTYPGFCGSFKETAQCHCIASGLPRGMCVNMRSLYDRMIYMFGSLQRACEYQHDTNLKNCIDSWNCYRYGGLTSDSEPCNGTGSACEA